MIKDQKRLLFIDHARGVAILLMIIGHFVSLTFSDYREMKQLLISSGTSGNFFFDYWILLRGFTAPLFFTISGMTFMYILSGQKTESFRQNRYVRKGIKRGLMLMLIGYAIQLNIKNIPLYLTGQINERFFAFHVLQSIGLGLILLVLMYGIYIKLKIIPLHIQLGITALIIFTLQMVVGKGSVNYFPSYSHSMIQNMFHGPNSIFPIVPWHGYLFAGGVIGVLFRNYKNELHQSKFRLRFFLIGLGSFLLLRQSYNLLDYVFDNRQFGIAGYSFNHLTGVILLLSIIMWIDTIIKKNKTILSMVGRNTLVIYVVHVILFYGAVIGYGVTTWYKSKLSAWESILGTFVFIVFFILITLLREFLRNYRQKLKMNSN